MLCSAARGSCSTSLDPDLNPKPGPPPKPLSQKVDPYSVSSLLPEPFGFHLRFLVAKSTREPAKSTAAILVRTDLEEAAAKTLRFKLGEIFLQHALWATATVETFQSCRETLRTAALAEPLSKHKLHLMLVVSFSFLRGIIQLCRCLQCHESFLDLISGVGRGLTFVWMMGEESSPLVAVQALGVHHVQWLVDGKHPHSQCPLLGSRRGVTGAD